MGNSIVPRELIEHRIFVVRGQKVILDFDLAMLYGATTKRLNEQVRRNCDRFPEDFCFQLGRQEMNAIRSQIATAPKRNVRYLPYAFTEHGAIMAANILKSNRAVYMSVYVVRAFVKLREAFSSNKDLMRKLEDLEKKYDSQFAIVFEAIRRLMTPPERPKRQMGFRIKEPKMQYAKRVMELG